MTLSQTPPPASRQTTRERLPSRRQAPLLREVYGGLIRALRTRQGRTLTDVAGRAGISVAYLSEIERGLKEASSEVLEAVCISLGSDLVHLVGGAHRELLRDADELARANDSSDGARVLDLTRRHPGRSVSNNRADQGHSDACLLSA